MIVGIGKGGLLEKGSSQRKQGEAFLLTVGFFYLLLSFFTYSPLGRFLDTLSHRKQRSSIVSKKARTVSKKAQIVSKKSRGGKP